MEQSRNLKHLCSLQPPFSLIIMMTHWELFSFICQSHIQQPYVFLEILFFLTYFPLRFSGVNLNLNMELLLRSKLLIIIPNPGKFSVSLETVTMLGTLCLTVLERRVKLYTLNREKPQENTLCHLLRVSSLNIRHIE